MILPRRVGLSLLAVMIFVVGFLFGVKFDEFQFVLNSDEELTLLEIERSFWNEKLVEARSREHNVEVIRMFEDKYKRVNSEFRRKIPF